VTHTSISLVYAPSPFVLGEDSGGGVGTPGSTHTVRSTPMGNTTEKMKQGIKKAAGTVKEAAEQGKDAATQAVDKGKDTAARGAEKVQKKTDRAAEKVKDA
jgi:hypothetical protein